MNEKDIAAVPSGIASNLASQKGESAQPVQNKTTRTDALNALIRSCGGVVLDSLRPIDEVAAELGIDPKRLRGFIFRNRVGDPIGNASLVYGWSLETLRKRLMNAAPISAAP